MLSETAHITKRVAQGIRGLYVFFEMFFDI
jgi:hypothetical protein